MKVANLSIFPSFQSQGWTPGFQDGNEEGQSPGIQYFRNSNLRAAYNHHFNTVLRKSRTIPLLYFFFISLVILDLRKGNLTEEQSWLGSSFVSCPPVLPRPLQKRYYRIVAEKSFVTMISQNIFPEPENQYEKRLAKRHFVDLEDASFEFPMYIDGGRRNPIYFESDINQDGVFHHLETRNIVSQYPESVNLKHFPEDTTPAKPDYDLVDTDPIEDWICETYPAATPQVILDVKRLVRDLMEKPVDDVEQYLSWQHIRFCSLSPLRARLAWGLLQKMYSVHQRPRRTLRKDRNSRRGDIPRIVDQYQQFCGRDLSGIKTINQAKDWLLKQEISFHQPHAEELFHHSIASVAPCPCCDKSGHSITLVSKNITSHKFRIRCYNTKCKLANLQYNGIRPKIGSDGLRVFAAISLIYKKQSDHFCSDSSKSTRTDSGILR